MNVNFLNKNPYPFVGTYKEEINLDFIYLIVLVSFHVTKYEESRCCKDSISLNFIKSLISMPPDFYVRLRGALHLVITDLLL